MSFTLVFEVFRKEGLDQEQFLQSWLGEHAEIAAKLPRVREYQILPVSGSAEASDPVPDGFVLMRFDSEEDADAALASPEMAAAAADSANFARHFSTFQVKSGKRVV